MSRGESPLSRASTSAGSSTSEVTSSFDGAFGTSDGSDSIWRSISLVIQARSSASVSVTDAPACASIAQERRAEENWESVPIISAFPAAKPGGSASV
jgi:uncharacterized protein YwlG (UPF0340 family)